MEEAKTVVDTLNIGNGKIYIDGKGMGKVDFVFPNCRCDIDDEAEDSIRYKQKLDNILRGALNLTPQFLEVPSTCLEFNDDYYTKLKSANYRRLRCEYCGCLSEKEYGTCEHCGAPL